MSESHEEDLDIVIVRHIARRYGNVIDLDKSPGILAEILRNYGWRFVYRPGFDAGTMVQGGQGSSVGGTGGPSTGSGNPGDRSAVIALSDMMRGMLQLQRVVSLIDEQLKDALAGRE